MSEVVVEALGQVVDALACQSFSIVSDLLYSNDSRFDATSYAEEAKLALSTILAARVACPNLGDLCGTIWHPVQNQARSNFKRIYVEPEHGMPYVGSREMFFFPMSPEKFLSRRIPKLQDLIVPQGWLLVSRSGTVGNVLYVNSCLAKCAITDHAIRIEPVGVQAGYLYAFLSSKYGQPLISQSTYGSTVDELEPKHLATIPVPLFTEEQQGIHDQIKLAYTLRDEANQLILEAEAELYNVLQVKPFNKTDVEYIGDPTQVRSFEIDSGELGSRFDATHHVPITRSVISKLSRGKYGLVKLSSRTKGVYLAPRFARVYVNKDHGTPFLQGSHILMTRIHNLKYISNSKTDRMERWLINEGTVLITCSGTIGRIAVTTKSMDGWAASQHILRVTTLDRILHPGFLAVFLRTAYGQHQLQSKIYGGVVDELTAEDTNQILIPDVPHDEQKRVGKIFLKAYEMRDQANELEDDSIKRIEDLIGG